MASVPEWFYDQSSVVPYRFRHGVVEVLLITSMRRRRWVIPKGVIERHLGAEESALQEAYEEAGLRGVITGENLGTYSYRKWGGTCHVRVFPMEVHKELDEWPEAGDRDRRWFSVSEALDLIEKEPIREMVRRVERRLTAGASSSDAGA